VTSTPAPKPPLFTATFAALLASSLVFFIAGGLVLPVAPRFARDEIGATGAAFGIAIGLYSLAALAARPVVGWVADRFGRRPLLVIGALLTAAGTGLTLLVSTLLPFVAVRAILGVGEAAFLVAMLAAAADLAPPGRTGEAISLASLALWLGVAIGPVIGESLLGSGGGVDYAPVWIAAALLSGVAGLIALLVPETRPVRALTADGAPRPRAPLFHPAGLLPGILVLCASWGMAGFIPFLPLHAANLGAAGAGPALAIYGGIIVVVRLFGARLPDRLGAGRLTAVALAIIAVGLFLLGVLPGYPGLLAATAVFAVGIALVFPAIISLAIQRVPADERGSVVGTTSVFLDLAFGLAPVALTPLADAGGYSLAFLVSAVVAAIGVVIIGATRLATRPAAGLAAE
jgi:MFS family permease